MPVVPSAGEEVLWVITRGARRGYRGARGQDQWSASAVPLQGALIWLPGAKAWCAGTAPLTVQSSTLCVIAFRMPADQWVSAEVHWRSGRASRGRPV